jgi:hypothetical protein
LVLVKAWAEMIIIAFLTVALIGNAGFRAFLGRLGPSQSFRQTLVRYGPETTRSSCDRLPSPPGH